MRMYSHKTLHCFAVIVSVMVLPSRAVCQMSTNHYDLSAPVTYEDLMLIVSDSKGTAIVVFPNEMANGVQYRFRYLEKGSAVEECGGGVLFERITVKEPAKAGFKELIDRSETTMRLGHLNLGWSHCMNGRGWIYYSPSKTVVQIGAAEYFRTFDLRRFKIGK